MDTVAIELTSAELLELRLCSTCVDWENREFKAVLVKLEIASLELKLQHLTKSA